MEPAWASSHVICITSSGPAEPTHRTESAAPADALAAAVAVMRSARVAKSRLPSENSWL